MTMGGRQTLPSRLLAAFHIAMDLRDDKVAEYLFLALEAHAADAEWRSALEEAQWRIIDYGSSAFVWPTRHRDS